ncbi:MAG: trypsin-like serine protease [Desulfobacterales bacterium]|nr:trypsin-like serine protease [Desulfobacterales bacterium]
MFANSWRFLAVFLLALQLSFVSSADVVFLKNGKKIKTKEAWEEGGQVKCYRFGTIVGYPKDLVERIEKEQITEEEETDLPDVETKKKKTDIDKQLSEKHPPKNKIEKAGNGTVTIKTLIGSGSGFFITDDGYILTNRHVAEADQKGIKRIERELKKEKEMLKAMKKIFGRRKYLELEKARQKKVEEFEFLKVKSYYSSIKICLVDDTEFKVSVEAISDNYDLALLKLDGYKTPFIEPANIKLAQGQTLYAIGNPLNLSHSVTSGIFSSYRDGFIQTNVPLNAGNSGGPVITKDGKVVGISTWKMVGIDVEGLSFAIPIKTAIKEFKELAGLRKLVE